MDVSRGSYITYVSHSARTVLGSFPKQGDPKIDPNTL